MMRRMLSVMLLAALAGCGDGGTGVQGGQLQVQLGGQPARAVILRLLGPINGVSAEPGIQIYQENAGVENTIVILVAATGATLPSGTVARITVDDVDALNQYSARVLQGAGPAFNVLGTTALTASISR